jgi:hypothetical protein
MPSVIGALHSSQTPCAIAEQLTETNGDGGGNRFAFVEDIVEVLARDTKQSGDLAPGLARRGGSHPRAAIPLGKSGTGLGRALAADSPLLQRAADGPVHRRECA